MRRPSKPRSRRKTYLVVLAGLTIVALVAPASWTGRLISLAQVVVPFQHATDSAVDAVAGADSSDDVAPIDPADHESLRREKEALEHEVASLATRVSELQGEVDLLTATRLWEVEGQRIGAKGRLIPASVVTGDLLPWRSSRLITAGSVQGVQRGDAVASRHFTIDRGESEGVRDGMAILLREAFVGLVEQVGTHTCRVKLLTDPTVRMKVRIGRFTPEGFAPLEAYFWLEGAGEGRMLIKDAERREVDAGVIQVGDAVLSDPISGVIPTAMIIGRITAIDPDHQNPLLSILTVEPAVAPPAIHRVFVFDPDTDAQQP